MPCFSPLQGYKSLELTKNGKRKLVFSPKQGYVDLKMTVPCGNCLGCRIDSTRQKAIRIEHEVQTQREAGRGSCFITLTYSPESLVSMCPGGSLVQSHYSDFMKRLRRRITNPKDSFFVSRDLRIKCVYCGEYGDKLGRPHFHAIIFGYDFPDKVIHKNRKHGNVLYRSSFLEELWPYGHSTIGTATWQSGAYVARYVMKKISGDMAEDHYRVFDPLTGEVFVKKPEFNQIGNGIGLDWFLKYAMNDVYPKGEVVTKSGKKMKPPRYYDDKYAKYFADQDEIDRLKMVRKASADKRKGDNTPERLEVRKKVLESRIGLLKRDLDKGDI